MKLTTNILVKNNEETIENTLNSISSLDCKILVGNLASKDKTIEICRRFKNVSILDVSNNNNRSQSKNILIKENKTPWIFFIEPWEVLFSTKDKIYDLMNNIESYKINIIQNDLIVKQTRLWHKDKKVVFKNPVFETLNDSNSKYSEVYLISGSKPESLNDLKTIEDWRDSKPLSCEPLYYMAFYYLEKKEWKKFLNYANLYLYQEKTKNLSLTMMHYYCCMVKCYIDTEKNIKEAISHIVYCLSEKPLMAEFWCLLGDIYFSINDYDKAISFYENAVLLGSKRIKHDDYPIEISKYKEYPEKMIKSCLQIKENTRVYHKLIN